MPRSTPSGFGQFYLAAGLAIVLGFTGLARAGSSSQSDPIEAPKPVYYELRYRFQPEHTIHLAVEHRATLAAQHADVRDISRNSSIEHKRYRVISVDDHGLAILESTLDRVQMTAIVDGSEPQSMDSRHPENCPATYRRVLSMVGKPLARIRIRPNGTVVAVEPLVSGPQASSRAAARQDAGDDELTKHLLVAMPEEPIQIGDTWHEDLEVPVNVGGSLRQNVALRRKYTLEAVDGNIARIGMKTAMLRAVRDPQILSQLVMRTPQAVIEFDMEGGMILSRRTIVDETVIGAFGPNSSLRATSERTERLLDPFLFAKKVAAAPQTAELRSEMP